MAERYRGGKSQMMSFFSKSSPAPFCHGRSQVDDVQHLLVAIKCLAWMSVTFYDDLAEDKGLVLVRGDVSVPKLTRPEGLHLIQLLKPMYGLLDAPIAWHKTLTEFQRFPDHLGFPFLSCWHHPRFHVSLLGKVCPWQPKWSC